MSSHISQYNKMSDKEQEIQYREQHAAMMEDEIQYQEQCDNLAARGKRLRRAALSAGIMTVISIICTIYTTIAVRWALIEWEQPERTASSISEYIGVFKLGIFFDALVCILDIHIGVTLGLILVGAGVNPATACTVVVFKIVQQAVSAAALIFMIGSSLMLDESMPIFETIQKYFYSDNLPPIGTQISFMFLMLNQYGHYLSQIFGGVYMFMLGATIILWGVFPRYMGYSMCFAGLGYGINSCLFLFWPGYDGIITWVMLLPAFMTSFWLGGWLLINTPHPAKNRDLWGDAFTKRDVIKYKHGLADPIPNPHPTHKPSVDVTPSAYDQQQDPVKPPEQLA